VRVCGVCVCAWALPDGGEAHPATTPTMCCVFVFSAQNDRRRAEQEAIPIRKRNETAVASDTPSTQDKKCMVGVGQKLDSPVLSFLLFTPKTTHLRAVKKQQQQGTNRAADCARSRWGPIPDPNELVEILFLCLRSRTSPEFHPHPRAICRTLDTDRSSNL